MRAALRPVRRQEQTASKLRADVHWLAVRMLVLVCAVSLAPMISACVSSSEQRTAATAAQVSPHLPVIHGSLLAIARALDSAAAKANPQLRAFRYEVRFFFPGAARPPEFRVTGWFEMPGDDTLGAAFSWTENRNHSGHLDGPHSAPFHVGQVCSAVPGGGWRAPLAEPPGDHPPVRGWLIDFPRVAVALRDNQALFAGGVGFLLVTTARRLRVEDRRTVGCSEKFYSGIAQGRRLRGVDGARAIMEIEERPHRLTTPPHLAGYCDGGHYLILDAATGVAIEHGTYRRCVLFGA
jgi:hypothetical protein